MPGKDPARGARDTGRTDKGLGDRSSGGKGSDREDRALASQLDKVKSLGGTNIGSGSSGKSLGRQISDIFGGPSAYANNPNRPNYDTTTMGVPIAQYGATPMSLMTGQNLGMTPEASAALSAAFSGMSGINAAMGLTRAIQAATGMSGGPSVGGRTEGNLGGMAGGGGQHDTNRIGAVTNGGYQLPPGYMGPGTTVPPVQTPQAPGSSYDMLNQASRYLSPFKGYGVNTPAYSYFGPMKR